MDITPYVGWIVFLHVAGAFAFVAGHGVSILVAVQLRHERDRARLGALLDLSGRSTSTAFVGLKVLFISGIVAGISSARSARRGSGSHSCSWSSSPGR
jgi:hypothetical protein